MELEGFTDVSDSLRSGVYALCRKGVVIYVGKSKSMIGRINTHRRAWADRRKKESWINNVLGIPGLFFDEVHILPCPAHMLDYVEQAMIEKYRPHYNVQHAASGKIRAPIELVVMGQTLTLNKPPERCIRR